MTGSQSLTTVEVQETRSNEQDSQVAKDERDKDAKIPPPVAERVSKRVVELVTNLECTVIAQVRSFIEKISRGPAREEVAHVLAAGLTVGSTELIVLGRGTGDRQIVKLGDDHAADEAREGVEFVEPDAPELGDLRLGDRDTAEQCEDNDDEGVYVGGDEGRRGQCRDGLGERYGEDLSDKDDKELVAGARGVRVQARDVVDGDEEEDGAEKAVWHLGNDHREGEWEGFVGLGHLLAEGDHARDGVLGFDLGENKSRQDSDLEDNEDTVLERSPRVVELKVPVFVLVDVQL